MKIGINSRIYQNDNTGIPYYIERLYSTLLKESPKNDYVFFQTDNNKIIGNTKIIRTFKGYLGAFLFDLFTINKLIKSEKINIFHGPAHILPLFKQKNVKYIVTIHDLSFLVYPKYYPAFFRYYYKLMIGRAIKNANAIVAVSKNTKKDIIKYYKFGEAKTYVVYSGINKIYFSNNISKRIEKEKYFLSMSTHPKRKNIDSILRIIAEKDELKKYKFVLVGIMQDDQVIELKKIISDLGLQENVILRGYATEKELLNLYHYAEFFIYPSYYEGFGFPVLEAMAANCPVITSNNSSLKELINNEQFLIDPRNNNDIYAKIKHLLNLSLSEREKVIKENYQFAKRFTWESTAKEFLKICTSL